MDSRGANDALSGFYVGFSVPPTMTPARDVHEQNDFIPRPCDPPSNYGLSKLGLAWRGSIPTTAISVEENLGWISLELPYSWPISNYPLATVTDCM